MPGRTPPPPTPSPSRGMGGGGTARTRMGPQNRLVWRDTPARGRCAPPHRSVVPLFSSHLISGPNGHPLSRHHCSMHSVVPGFKSRLRFLSPIGVAYTRPHAAARSGHRSGMDLAVLRQESTHRTLPRGPSPALIRTSAAAHPPGGRACVEGTNTAPTAQGLHGPPPNWRPPRPALPPRRGEEGGWGRHRGVGPAAPAAPACAPGGPRTRGSRRGAPQPRGGGVRVSNGPGAGGGYLTSDARQRPL